MKKKITNNRGQVGIGTLIVFIALVLVAAIAAGVLINTAGFLQTQAEETGQDSTDQVADNINVIGEVGEVAEFSNGDDDNGIYETRLTVQRSPGSDDIDLSGLSIQYVGDNGFEQLVHVSQVSEDNEFEGSGTEGTSDEEFVTDAEDPIDADDGDTEEVTSRGSAAYLVQEITAESDGDAVMTDDGDRYEIVIPFATAFTGDDANNQELLFINDPEIADGDVDSVSDPGADVIRNDLEDVEVTDRTELNFDNMDLLVLQEGQQAELEITTDAGSQRNVAISAPDTLIDEEGGTVTL